MDNWMPDPNVEALKALRSEMKETLENMSKERDTALHEAIVLRAELHRLRLTFSDILHAIGNSQFKEGLV
jgi:hypothetical protein